MSNIDSISDLLNLSSDDDGNLMICGVKVRVVKETPNKFSIVDTIMAVRDIKYDAAQRQWSRLLNDYPALKDNVVYRKLHTRGGITPMATLDNLINIISKLKGEIAQKFATYAASSITRILGGDQTLHAEIDKNHAIQKRLESEDPNSAPAQFGQYVKSVFGDEMTEKESWALEWTEKRSTQKSNGIQLMSVIRDVVGPKGGDIYPIVENLHNQAVIGFDGTTTAFKRENAIPIKVPMANVMTIDQLDMRRMMAQKVKRHIEANINTMNKESIKSSTRIIRNNIKQMCEYLEIDGFSEENYERTIRKMLIENKKKNKRQRLLEDKKAAALC